MQRAVPLHSPAEVSPGLEPSRHGVLGNLERLCHGASGAVRLVAVLLGQTRPRTPALLLCPTGRPSAVAPVHLTVLQPEDGCRRVVGDDAMTRLSISVRLEDHAVQTGLWDLDLDERLGPTAQRARVAHFLACVGQAIVDENHRGVYHVIRPAACAVIDTEFRRSSVEADTGLPAAKVATAMAIAQGAALQLPAVPQTLSGTSSAIEMEWAAARLLIETGIDAMRRAYELLAPFERCDEEAVARETAG